MLYNRPGKGIFMQLFIATGIFHPESGGPATYLHHLLPEAVARGHQVTLLTFGDASGGDYPYPVTRISRQQSYPARQWQYYRAARRLWPGHDLAYVHSLGLPLPRAARPCVGKIVGDKAWERAVNKGWISPQTDIDAFQRSRQPLLVEIDKRRRACEARRFDHVIVPSSYLKQMVISWGVEPERVTVVYNALRTDEAPPDISPAEARAAFDLPAGPLLLTAARLVPWKGIDHTLEALKALPDVKLAIAGDGPDRSRLESLCAAAGLAKRVFFLGQVPHDRMPLLYRAVDYTLLYSGYEGLPHTLLESLQAGTPVIASNKGGNPEVVQDGTNGLLAPYVDVEGLADVLRRAFEPGQRQALAAQSHLGLERFHWVQMVDDTLGVLQSIRDSYHRRMR
jgi:glycosyltransferase involved in cell wall biosynthesis